MAKQAKKGGGVAAKKTTGSKTERGEGTPSPDPAVRTVAMRYEEKVPVKCIVPTPLNGRDPIDKKSDKWKLMVASVRERGVLEPLILRPHPSTKGMYEEICGFRRLTAAIEADLAHVPARIGDFSDKQAMDLLLAENADREDMKPLELAREFSTALGMGYSAQELAAKRKTSPGQVQRLANLVKLTKPWQDFAAEHDVGQVHLELIARYNKDAQATLFKHLLGDFDRGLERYFLDPQSLAELRKELGRLTHELRLAPWNLKDAALVPKAGACSDCAKRSDREADLFDETTIDPKAQNRARCLDAGCWAGKLVAHQAAMVRELEKEHGGKVLRISTEYEWGEDAKHAKSGNEIAQQYDILKKPAPGAIPAVVVKGNHRDPNAPGQYIDAHVGDVLWLKKKPAAGGSAKGADKSKETAEQKAERARVRVWAEVWKRVEAAVQKADAPIGYYMKPHAMLALVATYGLSYEADVTDASGLFKESDPCGPFDRLAKFCAADTDKLLSWLWVGVRENIARERHYYRFDDADLAEIKLVGALVQVDVEKLRAEVEAEFAQPKKAGSRKDAKAQDADEPEDVEDEEADEEDEG